MSMRARWLRARIAVGRVDVRARARESIVGLRVAFARACTFGLVLVGGTDRSTSLRSDERSTSPKNRVPHPRNACSTSPKYAERGAEPANHQGVQFSVATNGEFTVGANNRFGVARQTVHNILRLGELMRLRWSGRARRPLGTVAGAVCLAAVFGTGSAAAQGAGLFVDAEPVYADSSPVSVSGALTTGVGVAALRQRAARVDGARLAAARAVVERDGASRLTLNLFDDVPLVAVVDRIAATSAGYSLSGRIAGEVSSSVALVVNGDVIVGEVSTLTDTYTLRTARDGILVIRQLDPSTVPLEAPERQRPPSSARTRPRGDLISSADHARAARGLAAAPPAAHPSSAGPEDGSVIDILVVYTHAARTAEGGRDRIRALIDLMIAQTNLAFRYSGVITQLNLAHTAEVDYSVAENPDIAVSVLEDPSDGHLDELHPMRDRHAADLVALVVTHPYPYGGEARAWWWYPHLEDTDPSRIAFSITRSDAGSGTFTHEIGHNLGIQHDRYAEIRDGGTLRNRPHPWSYGYVNQRAFEPGAPTSSRWGTIMSYATQLEDAGFRQHHRLSRFSNPDQTYRGDPMGDPRTAPSSDPTGPADARRTINETRVTVANFRVAPCRGGGQDSAVCDRKALEALYDATGGWNWTNAANWRTDAPLDQWHGVRTDGAGRVTRLDLAGNGLIGRVPLDITNLSRLTYFDISGTAACIPSGVAFRTWRRTVLHRRGSTCIDPLTADRGALEALFDSTGGANWTNRTNWKTDAPLDQWYGVETHGLRVSGLGLGGWDETARRHVGNGLAGSLPAELGTLTDLGWLVIAGNSSLTGPIPAEVGSLTNLAYLTLEVNGLTGAIPVELANLKSLYRLNLLANRLTGGIPAEFGTLADLVESVARAQRADRADSSDTGWLGQSPHAEPLFQRADRADPGGAGQSGEFTAAESRRQPADRTDPAEPDAVVDARVPGHLEHPHVRAG